MEDSHLYKRKMCHAHVSVYIFVLLCVLLLTVNLQEDSFWPRAVGSVWIRKEEATAHQQEHEDEDWAQTSQDPLSAPHQVDEMQLRQDRKIQYVTEVEEQYTAVFFEITTHVRSSTFLVKW